MKMKFSPVLVAVAGGVLLVWALVPVASRRGPRFPASPAPDSPLGALPAAPEESPGAGTAIDIDLAHLRGPMLYSLLYEILSDPALYIGQTVRLRGVHRSFPDPATGKRHHFCFVADAMACCQQGIEFSPAVPDDAPDFPRNGDEITVLGVFALYEEDGETYVHLRDAAFVPLPPALP